MLGERQSARSGGLRSAGRLAAFLDRARGAALALILALSAVLQFYRLGDWQYFSDDQALQLNIMHGLLVGHHLPALGMALAVGRAHMGPLFYYLLAAPMWLGRLDPASGVAMIGLFQVATVYLIYRLCLLADAPWAGLCAAALYASSGLVVYWARFLWPNIAPFFVVVALYVLVAMALRRTGNVITLAGSVAAAAQMQPTAILFIPAVAAWLAAWRPRMTRRRIGLALGLVVLLFMPVIVYDLTHRFAELRAWLEYATTVRPGASRPGGLARGLAALELYGWRLIGFRTRSWVDALLAAAILGVVAMATGILGRPRAILARLLLLWIGVYALAFTLYRGVLHPHYGEPLYPWPFLAIGLLLDFIVTAPVVAARWLERRRVAGDKLVSRRPVFSWPGRAVCELPSRRRLPAERAGLPGVRADAQASPAPGPVWQTVWPASLIGVAMHALTALIVIGLVAANVHHLLADRFALDPYQLDSPALAQGNEITLGEMRQAADLIARSAAGQPYNFLTAVRDGAGGGFEYVQQVSSQAPARTPQPLQFLLVEPVDRPPWLWPPVTRGRWGYLAGGFVRLPHLIVWRLRRGQLTPRDTGPWRDSADSGGAVTAVAAEPAGGILAGFTGGAAHSNDGGVHWHAASWPHRPPNGLSVITSLAWSAACPDERFAGTFDGIMVSRDGGSSWYRPRAQPASPEVLSLLADPGRCGVVLAGTRRGIARTEDGGATWQVVKFGAARPPAVHALVRAVTGNIMYGGTTDGVWISRNGGAAWARRVKRGEPRPALCLLVDPGGSPILLAGTGNGLLYSGDGGLTWARTGHGLQGTVYALFDVDGRRTLLAGTDAGLYRSTDRGANWLRVGVPMDVTVNGFSASDHGRSIYAASNRGLYKTMDGGATWSQP